MAFDKEKFMNVVAERNQEIIDDFLVDAIYENCTLDDIIFMIDNGANPRCNDDRLFLVACAHSDTKILLYLINNWNVNINTHDGHALVNTIFYYRNHHNTNTSTIKLLLECGIKISDDAIRNAVHESEVIDLLMPYVDPQYIGKIFIEKIFNELDNIGQSFIKDTFEKLIKNGIDFNAILSQKFK